MCLFKLAGLHEEKGDDAQALRYHEQALAMRSAVLHEQHPDLARSQAALGGLQLRLGSPDKAEPLLAACLDRHRDVLPEAHWRTARAQRLYGECLAAMGRYEEATVHLRAAYASLRATLGEAHDETVIAKRAMSEKR